MTEQILIKSATPVPFNQCGEGTAPIAPNNTFGYGYLDVLAAVQMAQSPGVVEVQVLDSAGAAVTGITVQVRDQLTGYQYVLQTDATGAARASAVYAGDYLVQTPNDLSFGQSTVSIQASQQQTVTLQQQPLLYFFPFVAKQ
jgi:hypothetical protein